MKVILQTRFSSPTEIYNTDTPAGASTNVGKIVKSILKPYLKIQEGDYTLYQMNKSYPDKSRLWQLGFGLVAVTAILGSSALLYNIGKRAR